MAQVQRRLIISGVTAFWIAMAGPVSAQITPQAATPEESTKLDEIVVTAQRREENLQNVPVTVSAFSADTLASTHITSAVDLNKLTPSLLLEPNSSTVTPFLRGIGSAIASAGNEASVAFYIDGIYYSRVDTGLLRLNNIERVEVLSGPQGTLFGRNASGGLVQLVTRDPQPGADPELNLSVGYGNYQTSDANIYTSGTLAPKLAADLAVVVHNQEEGWGRNIVTGAETYYDKHFDVRSKFVLDIDDATRAKVVLDYEHADTPVGMSNRFFNYPQGYPDGSGRVPLIGFYDTQMDGPQYTRTNSKGASFRVEHSFEDATLSDTAAYRREDQVYGVDLDDTPQNYLNAYLPFQGEQESNELQLTSLGNNWLKYTAGLYYLHQVQQYVPGSVNGAAVGGLTEVAFGKQEVSTYAAYAQGTGEILPKLNLTLGGRYSRDDLNADGQEYLSATGVPGTSVLQIITPTTAERSFDKFSYKAALDYELKQDLHTYLSVSEGYKSATYSLFPFSPEPALPEVITAYELGLKSEWLDQRLRVNSAVFYYDIKDPQVDEILSPGAVTVTNAQKATDLGFDLDTAMKITSRLSTRLAVSLLNAKYTDYANAPTFPLNPNPPYGNLPPISVSGNNQPLPYAAHTTFTAGADYRIPTAVGDWQLTANYYRNSGFSFNPDNLQRQPAYGLLDAQVAYSPSTGHFKIRVYGSNLTNKQYYSVGYEQQGSQGNVGAPAPPRMYGVLFDYKY